jgi:tetratricopeptide (TPR) repeat protein
MSKRSPELFDLIEAYLSNQLDALAKADFEKKLLIDADFRDEVEKHQLLHKAMLDRDALEFRKKLINIENGAQDTTHKVKKRFNFNWKIAATILSIVGITMFFVFQNIGKDTTLFEQYFSVYPIEDTFRGDQNENLKAALQKYADGKYREAVLILEKLVVEMPDNYELKMYLGNAYLTSGKPNEALSEFKLLTTNTAYSEKAKWYMALCYLKNNEYKNTKLLLKEIIAYDGIYKKQARNLYEDLQTKLNTNDF